MLAQFFRRSLPKNLRGHRVNHYKGVLGISEGGWCLMFQCVRNRQFTGTIIPLDIMHYINTWLTLDHDRVFDGRAKKRFNFSSKPLNYTRVLSPRELSALRTDGCRGEDEPVQRKKKEAFVADFPCKSLLAILLACSSQ